MGKSGSKPKKGGKADKAADKKGGDAPAAEKPAETPAPAAAEENGAEEDDAWDSPCVYSKDKQVGVEDFDLIAVIGKGSFGKVCSCY